MNKNEIATLTQTFANWDDFTLVAYGMSHEFEYFDSNEDALTITLTGDDARDQLEALTHMFLNPSAYDEFTVFPVAFSVTRS
jgi:hypothetical protein